MSPPIRPFCIPYSGASAAVYARWALRVPAAIAVHPVELPGRGTRADEPFATDPHRLADRLAEEMTEAHRLGEPGSADAVFGHSLGALIAFELAHALIRRDARPPRLLVTSGTSAPAMRDDRAWRRPRTDAEPIADLRALGGTPEEAIASPELMEMVLPVLRADFLMCGAYAFRPRAPLPCPIRVLGGEEETCRATPWRAGGARPPPGSVSASFPVGHFFIQGHQDAVLARVARDLIGRDLDGQVAPKQAGPEQVAPEACPDGPPGREPRASRAAGCGIS